MHASRLRAAAICALLTSTFLCAPAMAQNPEFRNLDENGVDLTAGDFVTSFVEGSIGSGEGKLELLRMLGSGSTNGTVGSSQWDGILFNIVPSGTYVDFGFQSAKFPGAETRGHALTGGGGSYVYRSPDGTSIEFGDPTGMGGTYCDGSQSSCILLPTSISSPDGKTVTFGYEFWQRCTRPQVIDEEPVCDYWVRLGGVSNSYGYGITFTYAAPSGSGRTGPPAGFNQRTGATFHNAQVGSAPLATVSYSSPSTGVTDVTDMGGRIWRVTKNGTLNAIRRPGASADTTSATLSAGKVTSVTKEGVTTGYSRGVSGSTVTMTATNALSQPTTVVSNLTIGRTTSVTNALGKSVSYQYDSDRRLKRVTQPEGNYVEYSYDARGNVTQTQMVSKSSTQVITTSATYDAACANPATCNQPLTTTDARSNVTNYAYDPTHGGVTAVTLPAATSGAPRPETRYSYTLSNGEYRLTGVSSCQTTASCTGTSDEVRTTIGYDANGNVLSVSKGDGSGALTATQTMTYDSLGNLTTVDGPLAGSADTTRLRYNAARELIGAISADPDGGGALKHRAVRNSYVNGLLTKVENGTVNSQSDGDWAAFSPLQAVETTYDAYARPTVQTVKAGGVAYSLAQASYDTLGRAECVAQRMNPAAYGALPASACTLGTAGTFGNDRIARTEFDTVGRVWKVTSALGTAEASVDVTNGYSDNGQLASVTDAEGNRTGYEYDGFDRLAITRYPITTVGAGASSDSDYEQLGYDAGSNVVSRRLRDGQTITYGYDNINRIQWKNTPGSAYLDWSVSYGHDLLGRLTTAIGNGWASNSFSYDALGRLLTEQKYNAATYHAYDLAGRQTRLTWSDGLYVDYDFNLTGEMTAIRENGASAGVGVLAAYAYDDLGRRASVTRGNGTTTNYSYDAVSRLGLLSQEMAGSAHDFVHSFNYNPAGQIASVTRSNDAYAWGGHYNVDRNYAVNGLNQMTTAGATSLGYDGRGNLTSSGNASYGYTAENRMWSAPGAVMVYEPIGGQLLQYSTTPSGDLRFAWSGGQIVAELTTHGAITRRYVPGPGIDEPVVWYEGAGMSERRWLHADERGSVVAVSDASGNAIGVNRYDEYGIPASTNIGRFQYTGQAWLPELGMYYYKARIYSPTLGRFMQADPIGYGDGMNLYNYVAGDPINWVDPTGLKTLCWREGYSGELAGGGVFVGSREVCGQFPERDGGGTQPYLDGEGNAGGGSVSGSESNPQICKINTVTITRVGNNISIDGKVEFPNGQTEYLGAINSAWTGAFPPYAVDSRLTEGPGGLRANVAFGPGGRPTGDIGGPNLNLNSLAGATPSQRNYSLWSVGHEFGHSMKLGNQYTESGPNAGYEKEIMGAVNGKPNGGTMASVLSNCE